MKYQIKRHSIDILFIMLLFAGFLFTAVMLVTMGTREYRNIAVSMQENSSLRTPYAYLMQTVHQNKSEDAIHIEEIDGIRTLAVRREISGSPYILRIYSYGDSLMEMLAPEGNYDFTLAAGTRILPLQELELEEREDGVIIARITEETGRTDNCVISVIP
jgi:hypothetical protein